MGYINKPEDIKPYVSPILKDEVEYSEDYGFADKRSVDYQKEYTFTKRHFLGNVAIDYEYFCPELNTWFFKYELERRPPHDHL